jgi:hypothetical protein
MQQVKLAQKEGYMKHQSIACFTKALLVLAGLSACPVALAQDSKEALRPNKTITYELKLSGDDAQRAGDVSFQFATDARPGLSQGGYDTQFWSGHQVLRPSAKPGFLEATVTIPDTVISGRYEMKKIQLFRKNSNVINVAFDAGAGFTAPPSFELINDDTFGRIKVEKVNEKR